MRTGNVHIRVSSHGRGVNCGVHRTELRGMPCVLIINSDRIRGGTITIHRHNRGNSLNTVPLRRFVTLTMGSIRAGMVGWWGASHVLGCNQFFLHLGLGCIVVGCVLLWVRFT